MIKSKNKNMAISSKVEKYDELDQYDFLDDEYLNKVANKYSFLIGLFLIKFSILEHDLNIAVADFINDRAHDPGYTIIEKMMTNNKIELFYKLYVRVASFQKNKNKNHLKKVVDKLKAVNLFRNSLVHANWQSLSSDGFVRTKIIVDSQEGYIKFKKIQITPKIIREKIKEVDKLVDELSEYTEGAFEFN